MSRSIQAIRLAVALGLLAALSSASGGEKAPGWKPFLPAGEFEELAKRSLQRLRTLAKDEDATSMLRAEALILAGYTISARDPAAGSGLRQKAIKIATLATAKDTAADARKLAAGLTTPKGEGKATGPAIDWPAAIGDITHVMTPLANKAKGGDGIAVELQYTAKLKSQNGVEALLVALAIKKVSAASAGKLSKELEVVGYRVATIGALTRRRGPHKNKDDAKQWDEQSVVMRDAGVELAEAASKKDAAGILAASKRLVGTCFECHSNFK